MKKYDSYKDSGIEWIGEIPSHWAVNKVKHNFSFKTGFTPPSGKSEYYEDGTHVWINISDLQEKEISDSVNKITDKAIEDFKPEIVQKGSLLYSFKLSVGRVGFNTMDCYTNEAIFSINPDSSTNLNFFYYSLPDQILKNANENIYGAKILNQELIKNAYLVIPPTTEQTSIANFLDRKTSEIDDIIADKKRLLELYEEEKTAIINQAVTKGLDPNVPMKDSGIEWLGEIPEHWEVIPLTKYLESIVDYRGRTPKKQNEGLFLVTARNIKKRIIDYSLSEEYVDYEDAQNLLERGRPEIGDVLFTTEAPLGEVANIDRVDIALAQRVIKFRGKKGVLDNYFLKYFLSSDSFQQDLYTYSTGSTAIGIKASKLHHLTCLLPPISEQQSIVQHIETECSKIDFKKARTKELIELLIEYRTALISEAVTGKIKVTED
jgi:type I restriction enzyme S subunit